MNPVERDIRGYFGIAPEDSILSIMVPNATRADIRGVPVRIRISVQAIFCHVLRS